MVVRLSLLNLLLAAAIGVVEVKSQIGVSLCACQPSVYTFKFNFTAVCDINTIVGPGVRGADCFAREFAAGDPVNDTVPVQVSSVTVLELDRLLRVIAQTPYQDDFRDGDTFTYTSIAATPEGIATLTPDRWPGGLQLDIVGVNRNEEPITNVWIILFENDCGIYPILEVGDVVGWTILHDLQRPLQSVCPIAAVPTESPTLVPTAFPSLPSPPMDQSRPTATPSSTIVLDDTAEPTMCIPRPPGESGQGGSKGKGEGGKGGISSKSAGSSSKVGKGSGSSKVGVGAGGGGSSKTGKTGGSSKAGGGSSKAGKAGGSSKSGGETETLVDESPGKGGSRKGVKGKNNRLRDLRNVHHPFYGIDLDATGRGVGNRPDPTSSPSQSGLPFCPDSTKTPAPKKKIKAKSSRSSKKIAKSMQEKKSKMSKSKLSKAKISKDFKSKGKDGMSSKSNGKGKGDSDSYKGKSGNGWSKDSSAASNGKGKGDSSRSSKGKKGKGASTKDSSSPKAKKKKTAETSSKQRPSKLKRTNESSSKGKGKAGKSKAENPSENFGKGKGGESKAMSVDPTTEEGTSSPAQNAAPSPVPMPLSEPGSTPSAAKESTPKGAPNSFVVPSPTAAPTTWEHGLEQQFRANRHAWNHPKRDDDDERRNLRQEDGQS